MFEDAELPASDKDTFLKRRAIERSERETSRHLAENATTIQKVARGFLARRRFRRKRLQSIERFISEHPDWSNIDSNVIFMALRGVTFSYSSVFDDCLEKICRLLSKNILNLKGNEKSWYISLCLHPKFAKLFLKQSRCLMSCIAQMMTNGISNSRQSARVSAALSLLAVLSDGNNWLLWGLKKFEKVKPAVVAMIDRNLTHVRAEILVSIRKLLVLWQTRASGLFSNSTLKAVTIIIERCAKDKTLYLEKILTVPGLVLSITKKSPESISHFVDIGLPDPTTNFSHHSGTSVLSIYANSLYILSLGNNDTIDQSTLVVFIRMLEHIQENTDHSKASNMSWHPILGYCVDSNETQPDSEQLALIKDQLACMWKKNLVAMFFFDVLNMKRLEHGMTFKEPSSADIMAQRTKEKISKTSFGKTSVGSFIQRAIGGIPSSMKQVGGRQLNYPEVVSTTKSCYLYTLCMSVFVEKIKLDILTGLFGVETFLKRLWVFICEMGPSGGLDVFEKIAEEDTPELRQANAPYLAVLSLFCQCSALLLSIADEDEFFEKQHPFSLEESKTISLFLKNFLFKLVWKGVVGGNEKSHFTAIHRHGLDLLALFYDKDTRRNFTDKGHWLIKLVKPATIMGEFDKGKPRARLILEQMPFLIPFDNRVSCFRKLIQVDQKGANRGLDAGNIPHHIVIKRTRLIEDGFNQLSRLRANQLKSTVRVKFYNDLGLAEAGIDQDGVFKEFLEETVAKIFNVQFNLFQATKLGNALYPSHMASTSSENLELFNYIGKLLGKAVYEGIVLDVHFAPFFLRHLSHHSANALYSSIDDLPSFDPELAKNLAYVKHCEDASDLGLNFEWTEDILGQMKSYELRTGGRDIAVTNQNRISYIHSVAHFRLFRQIKAQSAAFSSGFHQLINRSWLSMFSTSELQRLISGNNDGDIDFADLRKHVLYFGGFHGRHRVITWLWDILENDFKKDERSAFLKFVTSCSCPPLLGFAHLQPPFSIRCVEVGDDDDRGDTLGSVLRGFLSVRKTKVVQGRLPTASTCFNLLKLPNYSKKSILREKLRLAITMNTGFELS